MNVSSIERLNSDECAVKLRNGEELELGDSQDFSDKNSGLLIYADEDRDPVYVPWHDMARIEFKK